MSAKVLVLALALAAAFACTSAAGRHLLAPVPVPAPAPGPGGSYTVPNWRPGVTIANATLPVGGTILIPWMGTHGVYQITTYSCPSSFPTPNPNGQVVGPSSGGSFSYTFSRAGRYYFACQVGDHCSEGQLIAVTVS